MVESFGSVKEMKIDLLNFLYIFCCFISFYIFHQSVACLFSHTQNIHTYILHTLYYFTSLHLFIVCIRIFPANKKANLINGSVAQQQPNGSPSSDEYQSYQTQFSGNQQSRSSGPNLVNKQLVLPFVPPSFPNGSTDGSNHLIKPSEYLKSISDKRSSASSAR